MVHLLYPMDFTENIKNATTINICYIININENSYSHNFPLLNFNVN